MTLEQILNSAVSIVNQSSPSLILDYSRVDLFMKLVNIDYFKLWVGLPEDWQPGQPITKRGWQVAAQATEALKNFLVTTQNYVVDPNGQLVYPAGFVHLSDIGYYNNVTSRYRQVEIVSHAQKWDRLGNPITAPEKEYPIVVYENTYLQFYPVDLLNVDMSFLRLPTAPVFVIKQENGVDVYDSASSTEFEWEEKYHPDLIRLLVGYLAPALKDTNLSNFIENKKIQGV
jgi:hypothetical protein